MTTPPPMPEPADNCGLPPGVIHQHVGVCWRAGYEAGYAAANAQEATR